MATNRGTSGNSVQEARDFQLMQAKFGAGLTLFEYLHSDNFRGSVELNGFSVRPPRERGGEWLVIVRGYADDGTPVVAFHSALSVGEAVAGASKRIQDGTVKWKADQFRA